MTSIAELKNWLKRPESVNLEFKAAKTQFDTARKLPDYCAAISNEGGGKLILGVNDRGKIVGTEAYKANHNKLSHFLLQKISLKIDVEELTHPKGRLVIFHIPARPVGIPIKSSGKYLMRAGESLVEMDTATLKNIFRETQADFSAMIVEKLNIEGLDQKAITRLRKLCYKKSNLKNYLTSSVEQFLADIGLKTDRGLNYAGLILLGSDKMLAEYLANTQIIFEWRQIPGKTHHDFRKEWRAPLLGVIDEIWEEVDKRNFRTPYQEGFVQREIFAFDRDSIREAVLNAVVHRDYTRQGDLIFITASPEKFLIESPGGFLPGINAENAPFKRAWRNQRLAEVLCKTGLIEQSGQGLDIIFEKAIRGGKGFPDLSKSDNFHVRLEIPTKIKDEKFILFLEKITNEKQITLSFEEIYELENIRERRKLRSFQFKKHFLKLGIIEKIGEKRGTEYILSQKYYEHIGRSGLHTRLAGTSREQKKILILNHIKRFSKGTSAEFQDALELDQLFINNLLKDLKIERKIEHVGSRRYGYWILSKNQ